MQMSFEDGCCGRWPEVSAVCNSANKIEQPSFGSVARAVRGDTARISVTLFALICVSYLAVGSRAIQAEVIVEALGPSGLASGLKVGDRLVGWQAGDTDGTFDQWFDGWRFEFLHLPHHGRATIQVVRGVDSEVVNVGAEPLGLSVRPSLTEEQLRSIDAWLDSVGESVQDRIQSLKAAAASLEANSLGFALARLGRRAEQERDALGAAKAYRAAAGEEPDFAGELLTRVGRNLLRASQLDAAETAFREAVAAWSLAETKGVPLASLAVSIPLSAQGDLAGRRYRLGEGKALLERACLLRRSLAANSWLVAGCLNNLGIIAGTANDLAVAEERFLEALDIERALGRQGARQLTNLGVVARRRGDLDRAASYLGQSLKLRQGSQTLGEAEVLTNLASVVGEQGSFAEALTLYERAGVLYSQIDASALPTVAFNRAKIYQLSGQWAEATTELEKAKSLLGPRLDGSVLGARVKGLLAEDAMHLGELQQARVLLSEAFSTFFLLLPDTTDFARTASLLAVLTARLGDHLQAADLFVRSIAAIEAQQKRIGGGARGWVEYRDKVAPLYQHYIDFLLERGKVEEAYELYERSRGQALVALMNQRYLDIQADVSAEHQSARYSVARTIESEYRKLMRLPEDATQERSSQRVRIENLHTERDALSARIRSGSAARSALEAPPSLSVAELRLALPAGTLVVAYDLRPSGGTVFSFSRDLPLAAHAIEMDSKTLRDTTERWLRLASSPRRSAELRPRAIQLTNALLAPIADRIDQAERLLVIPYGPLQLLSFAALPSPTDHQQYLVQQLPVSRDLSASIHVADRQTEPGGSPIAVVFGDPQVPEMQPASGQRNRGALPSARDEAKAVAAIFGDRAHLYLGEQATEEEAKRSLPDATVIHFATHAILDQDSPLDSSLVLSPSTSSQGLLHAWEIIESVQLKADLVVLSACETARGEERAGEGIVGLVNALKVAGAKAVLASLWRVEDRSTEVLMARFYSYLANGDDTAVALRNAQLDLLSSPIEVEHLGEVRTMDASHPRYWAAFVLLGPTESVRTHD